MARSSAVKTDEKWDRMCRLIGSVS